MLFKSFLIKQLEKYKDEKQQGVVPAACVNSPVTCSKDAECTVIIKKQQKYKYKEEECTITFSTAVFEIRHIINHLSRAVAGVNQTMPSLLPAICL